MWLGYQKGRIDALKEAKKAVSPVVKKRDLSKGATELLLSKLNDIIEAYGYATMNDFNILAGLDSTYVDCYFGWTDISSSYIYRKKDGYWLNLAAAKPLTFTF